MGENVMRALVKERPEKGIWLKELPVPQPGANEVRIKITKTAICGTDIHIYKWDEWAQKTIPQPMTIGHEYVGYIDELGSQVRGFKKGDRVTGEGHITCGVCHYCRTEQSLFCPHTVGVGVNRPGCFADFLIIPAASVWRCDDWISDDVYSFFDAFGNAVHTAFSFPLIGEDVLVTGAGPIGIMAAMVAQSCMARNVIITDVNEYRLNLARKAGIKQAINVARDNLAEVLTKQAIDRGITFGMEMAGNKNAFNQIIDSMAANGNVAILGLQQTDTVIDWDKVVFSGLNIKGIYGRKIFATWYNMTDLIKSGFDPSPVITHRFSVTDYQEAFSIMASTNSGKIILDWLS